MGRYRVYVAQEISTVRTVDAASEDEAIDEVLTEGFPSVMFVNHDYPDEGEWDVVEVEQIDTEGDGDA